MCDGPDAGVIVMVVQADGGSRLAADALDREMTHRGRLDTRQGHTHEGEGRQDVDQLSGVHPLCFSMAWQCQLWVDQRGIEMGSAR